MSDNINNIKLNLGLSIEQAKYYLWIDKYMPYLMHLFDFKKREVNIDRAKAYVESASDGEAIMARFAIGIWCRDDILDFNFIDAIRTLDEDNVLVITNWMKHPFWP